MDLLVAEFLREQFDPLLLGLALSYLFDIWKIVRMIDPDPVLEHFSNVPTSPGQLPFL